MVVITYYNARVDGNGEIRGIRGGQYMKDLRTEKGIIMSKNIKVTMTAIFSMCILLVAAAGVKADSNLQQKTVHILTKQEKEQKQELQQIKKELTNHSKSYQKNNTEDLYDYLSCKHDHTHFIRLTHCLIQCRAVTQKFHHINHCNTENTGDYVWNICAFVVSDILFCKSGKNSLMHAAHHLS